MTASMTSLAQQLIQSEKTLVLATAAPHPWAAPVYYVYRRQRFYFFSSPRSRHITEAKSTSQCAASLYRDSDDWRAIEGLQMSGRIEELEAGREALAAFTLYLRKFPSVKDFFAGAAFDFAQFQERFRSRLYAFVADEAFYLNNAAGFGTRQEITLESMQM